jgi:hypothetical protein
MIFESYWSADESNWDLRLKQWKLFLTYVTSIGIAIDWEEFRNFLQYINN